MRDPIYNPIVPPHVPPDRVLDFNVFQPTENPRQDVFEVYYELMSKGCPDIFWTRNNGGHWVVASSDRIQEIFSDPVHFSNARYLIPAEHNVDETNLIPSSQDQPDHTLYRAIINPSFSPRAIRALEEDIRHRVIKLIEQNRQRGACEFIEDIARILPIEVFMSLCGVDTVHRDPLLKIVDDSYARRTTPGESQKRLQAYLQPILAERRLNPGDDVLSALVKGRFKDRPLTEDELLRFSAVLLHAGLDSIASMLGLSMYFLSQNKTHRQQLIDEPALLPMAVEEMVRRYPTNTSGPSRRVAADVEIGGVVMKAEDRLAAPRPFATLDPRRFKDPLTVDFTRSRQILHQGFGVGPHMCIGAFLARSEIRIFLEEWLKMIPEFSLAPGFEMEWSRGRHSSVHHLPLVWPV